jgi:hypothetical protein
MLLKIIPETPGKDNILRNNSGKKESAHLALQSAEVESVEVSPMISSYMS